MSKNLKILTYCIAALVIGIAAAVVYRLFFQFDWKEIDIYAREEAARTTDPKTAYKLIIDGVEAILGSHNHTQQVLRMARATRTDKEQELVNAAINQCRAYNYFTKQV